MIKKNLLSFILVFMLQQTYAYAMAISLQNIILYNDTKKQVTFNALNINKTAKINVPARSSCLINKEIFFQPNLMENKNTADFYIIFSVESQYNAIYMDEKNRLNLASKGRTTKAYSTHGLSKFNLNAICENKQINRSPISTRIINKVGSAPTIAPKYCTTNNYNFVFGFGNHLLKSKDLSNITNCIIHE